MAWGCFYEVFTFFLEDVGRMSPDRAAAVSTYTVLVYESAQAPRCPCSAR